MNGSMRILNGRVLANLFTFNGYQKEHNKRHWLSAVKRLDRYGNDRIMVAATGLSACHAISNKSTIIINFFKKGSFEKDIVSHSCHNELDVVDTTSQYEMDMILTKNFGGHMK